MVAVRSLEHYSDNTPEDETDMTVEEAKRALQLACVYGHIYRPATALPSLQDVVDILVATTELDIYIRYEFVIVIPGASKDALALIKTTIRDGMWSWYFRVVSE